MSLVFIHDRGFFVGCHSSVEHDCTKFEVQGRKVDSHRPDSYCLSASSWTTDVFHATASLSLLFQPPYNSHYNHYQMDIAAEINPPEELSTLSYDETVPYEEQLPDPSTETERTSLANRIGSSKVYLLSESSAARVGKVRWQLRVLEK